MLHRDMVTGRKTRYRESRYPMRNCLTEWKIPNFKLNKFWLNFVRIQNSLRKASGNGPVFSGYRGYRKSRCPMRFFSIWNPKPWCYIADNKDLINAVVILHIFILHCWSWLIFYMKNAGALIYLHLRNRKFWSSTARKILQKKNLSIGKDGSLESAL